jgi:hypothetical protein
MKHLIQVLVACSILSAAETSVGYVPSTTTTVTTSTAYLYKLHLSNESGSAVTITITDRSTNCGGAGCKIWGTISIAANTVYTVDMAGVPASSGFTWAASTGSAVVGWISYGTTR